LENPEKSRSETMKREENCGGRGKRRKGKT